MKLSLLAVLALALTSCGSTITGSYTTKEGATFSAGIEVPKKPAK